MYKVFEGGWEYGDFDDSEDLFSNYPEDNELDGFTIYLNGTKLTDNQVKKLRYDWEESKVEEPCYNDQYSTLNSTQQGIK